MKCLIVKKPFAEWIAHGIKPIEYRTRKTNIRGKIGIICEGRIIGDVDLVNCTYNEEYGLSEWHLENPRPYKTSVTYERKKGTVVWVNVDYNPYDIEIAPKIEYTYDWLEECKQYEKNFIQNYIKERN